MSSPADSNVDDDANSNATDASSTTVDPGSNTVLNAVIGAVVTVVFTFTAFSPILGGAVAGYLEKRDGLRVGALSGAIATLPILLFSFFTLAALGLFAGSLIFLVLLLVALPLVLCFVVGLSALGGVLGVYLAEEL